VNDVPVNRSARLVIVDAAGRLLLFQYDDRQRPPFWSTVGGRVEPGEDYVDAAARELREETGFNAPIGPVLRTRDAVYAIGSSAPARYAEQYFLVRCAGGDPDRSRWTAEERTTIRAHRWWTLEDMRAAEHVFLPEWLPDLLASVHDDEFHA
jgi:8-oxo-dGTP diphosphatase